ncbi:hypothetical protein LguiA_029527 [Lonicera macranthoides]
MVPINPILGEPPSRCWSPLNDTNRAQLASNIEVYHDTDLHSSGIPELAIICRMSEDSNTGNSEIGLIIRVVIPPGPIPSSGIVMLKPTPTVVAAANATSPPTLALSPHPLGFFCLRFKYQDDQNQAWLNGHLNLQPGIF